MKQPGRIDQLVNCITDHDAVSNHIRKLQARLRQRGFVSEVFAERDLCSQGASSRPFEEWSAVAGRDAMVIYHHSIGNQIPKTVLLTAPQYKIVTYHNVTPRRYFEEFFEPSFHIACSEGVRQLSLLGLVAGQFWADSAYNADELTAMGMHPPMVVPVIRDYGQLSSLDPPQAPDLGVAVDRLVLLFVGRIAAHKAQHDLIWLTKALKDRGLRPLTVIVGGHVPNYMEYLKDDLAPSLNLASSMSPQLDTQVSRELDIWFPGEVNDDLLHALYKRATLFVSMSEHEGFCVPLVEAMYFGLPIAAHRAAAVGETLGSAGLLFDKEQDDVPALIKALLLEPTRLEAMKATSRARARDFAEDKLLHVFDHAIDAAMADFAAKRATAPVSAPVKSLSRWMGRS